MIAQHRKLAILKNTYSPTPRHRRWKTKTLHFSAPSQSVSSKKLAVQSVAQTRTSSATVADFSEKLSCRRPRWKLFGDVANTAFAQRSTWTLCRLVRVFTARRCSRWSHLLVLHFEFKMADGPGSPLVAAGVGGRARVSLFCYPWSMGRTVNFTCRVAITWLSLSSAENKMPNVWEEEWGERRRGWTGRVDDGRVFLFWPTALSGCAFWLFCEMLRAFAFNYRHERIWHACTRQ